MMTRKSKGIVLLILSVLCAALFVLAQLDYFHSLDQLGEIRESPENDDPLKAAAIVVGYMAIVGGYALISAFLFAVGAAFAISAVAVIPGKKQKWIFSSAIVLQAGVLAVLLVQYGDFFKSMIRV